MKIRDYDDSDFPQVVRLLKECGVDPPYEPDEIKGLCLVAEDEAGICGCVYALVGQSSKAYGDFLAIRSDLRGSRLYFRLLTTLEERLKELGVKRYVFHVEKHNHAAFDQLYKYRQKYRITMLNDMHYFMRTL